MRRAVALCWLALVVVRPLEVSKQLLEPVPCRGVAFDLSLPAACGGVVDELLLDGKACV